MGGVLFLFILYCDKALKYCAICAVVFMVKGQVKEQEQTSTFPRKGKLNLMPLTNSSMGIS